MQVCEGYLLEARSEHALEAARDCFLSPLTVQAARVDVHVHFAAVGFSG